MMLSEKIIDLKVKITAMALIVEKMVSYSFSGEQGGASMLPMVTKLEQHVNQVELEIEEDCITLIALQQPEAKDLRMIMMIFKMNNDLERLGDQAYNIAESSAKIAGIPNPTLLPELTQMKQAALKMLTDSIVAFGKEDAAAAREVCKMDEVVDGYNRKIYDQIVVNIKHDPQSTEHYLHLLRIAKNLERIGDLSTNIAENTIYLTQGKVIKHPLSQISANDTSE